jgi:cyclic pyranopterin phosphate synthase
MLRDGSDDEAITAAISEMWSGRDDRYSEIRSEATTGWEKVEMSYIGG